MKKLLSLFAILLSASCTAAITNIYNVPYSGSITKEEAAKIIVAAGAERGWRIKRISSDMLEGTLYNGKHTVVVSIPIKDKGYSILYQGSVGMNADGVNIHRAYNRWVRNLEGDINNAIREYVTNKGYY
jgi:hypothetical protein